MDKTGISYTEKEYDYAVSQSIPVLAFIRSDEENIPVGKVEMDVEIREKLKKFKQKVGNKHHLNYWKSIEELKANVLSSLSMAFVMNSQTGWVKAGGIDNIELLSRLADLQKRYDDLIEENIKLKEISIHSDPTQFAFGSHKLQIDFKYTDNSKTWQCEISWHDLFFLVGKTAVAGCHEIDIEYALSYLILDYFEDTKDYVYLSNEIQSSPDERHKYKLSKESFKIIRNQFLALELISIKSNAYTSKNTIFDRDVVNISRVWELTDKGRKLFLSETAIKYNNHI